MKLIAVFAMFVHHQHYLKVACDSKRLVSMGFTGLISVLDI
jgi:hypothetical protein